MRALTTMAALGLTLAVTPASAASLADAGKLLGGATSATATQPAGTTASATSALLGALTSELKVTPQQATGGAAALLGLAQNQLGANQYAQLAKSVPGLESLTGSNALSSLGALGSVGSKLGGLGGGSSGAGNLSSLLGNVQSLADVNKVFSALGMNSSMVSQFAPILLGALGQQGASSGLLSQLGSLWGVSGAQ